MPRLPDATYAREAARHVLPRSSIHKAAVPSFPNPQSAIMQFWFEVGLLIEQTYPLQFQNTHYITSNGMFSVRLRIAYLLDISFENKKQNKSENWPFIFVV